MMRMSSRWAVFCMMLFAAPLSLPAQVVTLKDTQTAIRERIIAEAGSDSLIYSAISFDGCAVMIQARTPKNPKVREQRTAWSFLAASLDPTASTAQQSELVELRMLDQRPSVRRIETTFDAGGVVEKVTFESTLTLFFAQSRTATTVLTAFRHLAELCAGDGPFKAGKT